MKTITSLSRYFRCLGSIRSERMPRNSPESMREKKKPRFVNGRKIKFIFGNWYNKMFLIILNELN